MDEPPKTNYTAVVLIPPPEAWEPIQRIRRQHDPQVNRWMPHVTLLYPFFVEPAFAEVAERLQTVCRRHAPFRLTLAKFGFFLHSPRSATLWLDLEPREPIIDLQADLEGEFPSCRDVSSFQTGYVPHLSVGRFPGRDAVSAALQQFQFAWFPLEVAVESVALIARSGEPDDPFHVRRTIPLAGGSAGPMQENRGTQQEKEG